MTRAVSIGLLMLRIAFGGVIALHGYNHLMQFHDFVPKAGGMGFALGAVAGEFLGGMGLAAGLATRGAGAGMGTVMLAIAFTRNVSAIGALGTGPGTAFEYPFLVGVLGWAFTFIGAGDLSLDRLFWGPRED